MSSADLPWSGLWPGGVAGVVQAAAHARARCARLVGARVVQGAAAGELPEFGGQGHAVVDFCGPPAVDVQQQAVQRSADPVRRRSGAGAGRGWGRRGRGRRRGRSAAARLRSRRPASQPPPTTPARRRARPLPQVVQAGPGPPCSPCLRQRVQRAAFLPRAAAGHAPHRLIGAVLGQLRQRRGRHDDGWCGSSSALSWRGVARRSRARRAGSRADVRAGLRRRLPGPKRFSRRISAGRRGVATSRDR
ncbi:hypothetical protein QF034_000070 [Streptomyces africanus]|uniref:Uncharacterized protein n=1 Tax=Streptomyces africanus TaxID=231024 RepID=A0ABU0QEM8_9ACTN|nr:hypothetical protein [Streptomyces africanus]